MPRHHHSGNALQFSDITVRRGGSTLLDHLTFGAPVGSRIGLVGANGAGKSTLLKVAVGLARATSGTVSWAGSAAAETRAVAFVPQGKPLYPALTPAHALVLARSLNTEDWDEEAARSWMDAFEIPLSRQCSVLSGGERTQVAIALALGRGTPHLVLDEPFAELDPLARADAIDLLRAVLDSTGRTLLISSHLLSDIDDLCDHLMVLSRGRLTLAGTRDEILAEHPGQSVSETAMAAMRLHARSGERTAS
ncbi:ATP-binding cassette domain-containing protein [Cellulomonas soli]|uniref:ABC transporter domain-containing protein n=1 Tax=Cellulomonas soli TaxID=931535 RepID=A0A512PCZ1_9CELL|nr:ABC transporter ATP-binding protein [Cellulomonas soli]NYI58650.1 ABC-2 type transport system ATP-binding protein [Cellulomonas soli]GEP69075.1 hypothetical protein CSO01_17900 [Cellulomonas soli]